MDVDLRELDEPLLVELLRAAVAGADPLDVMPHVDDDAPGWTRRRREAFLAFHRERSVATSEPVERTWAIVVDGRVVGAARLEPVGPAVEAGIWVGLEVRGTGVGRAAMRSLLTRAEGRPVVAETTEDNAGAVGLLHGLGGTVSRSGAGGALHAELPTLQT